MKAESSKAFRDALSAACGEINEAVVSDNYLGRRIASAILLPKLTRCLT